MRNIEFIGSWTGETGVGASSSLAPVRVSAERDGRAGAMAWEG
jgi:hypothetical protein